MIPAVIPTYADHALHELHETMAVPLPVGRVKIMSICDIGTVRSDVR